MFVLDKKNIFILLSLFAFVFFVHILFIMNLSSYWDSTVYINNIVDGKYTSFITPWKQNGRLLIGVVYFFIGHNLASIFHINGTLAFRLFSVFGIALSGSFVYIILQKFMRLDTLSCFFIAALGAIYPAYQVHLSFTTIIFVLCLPFYLLGLYLSLVQVTAPPTLKKYSIRYLGLLCILISFISEATIPLAFFTIIMLFVYKHKNIIFVQLSSIFKFILTNLDYILLPILYLFAMMRYMAPYGPYEHSRDVSFHLATLYKLLIRYIAVGFDVDYFNHFAYHRVLYSERFLGFSWVDFNLTIFLFSIMLLLFVYFYNKYHKIIYQKPDQAILTKKYFLLYFIGILAFLFSISSFIIAQREPYFAAWNLRFFTIAAFPFSIIIVSYVKLILLLTKKYTQKIFIIVMLLIVLLTSITLWKDCLIWLSRAAMDESIVVNLKQHVFSKKLLLVVIIQKYFKPVFGDVYRNYEWTYLVHRAKPKMPSAAIPAATSRAVTADDIKKTVAYYQNQGRYDYDIARRVNLNEMQIISMSINKKGKFNETNWLLGAKYLIKKLSLSGDDFNKWLRTLTTVEIKTVNIA